ncbi:MAG: GNAT family N-acetyltransferase [Candidatus Muproteobacteria bacterium RBG_16_62_13]|uniref:Amino-acid acetyltransferase n=1 Tax=Candidatus Muproteobacteria bacterium RBG_16_62_13 TaxID=1817756 RepID=A0A1F6T3L7_9PROT|nr:MAG: GNAT family N-acetyltransferase [Candidatus Muproteobacteria bacterium RBG_16_62_13]
MRETASVRPAAIHDVPEIHQLLELYAAQGNLLPRSMSELYRHLRDFFVVDSDGRVVGCGALEIFTDDLGEVRSLVVADEHKGHGHGRQLVERIIAEAKAIGLKRLMALTYVPDFFHKLGFRTVPKNTLPEKVWSVCIKCYKFNHCDETAVLLDIR